MTSKDPAGDATLNRARFRMTVFLANAAMQTGSDLAEVLRKAADTIEQTYPSSMPEDFGWLPDRDGNTVGEWEV